MQWVVTLSSTKLFSGVFPFSNLDKGIRNGVSIVFITFGEFTGYMVQKIVSKFAYEAEEMKKKRFEIGGGMFLHALGGPTIYLSIYIYKRVFNSFLGCPRRIPARKVNDYGRATCPLFIKTKSCLGFVFVTSGVRVWATVYAFGL